MNPIVRASLAMGVIACVLLGAMGWTYSYFVDCRRNAQLAAENYNACRQLAERIDSLQKKPSLAVSRDLQVTELSRRLEDALGKSDIATDDLARVTPEAPRRIGDTAYLERSTQVVLRNVTLRQVIVFLTSLAGEPSGLSVAGIRLTAPRNVAAGE